MSKTTGRHLKDCRTHYALGKPSFNYVDVYAINLFLELNDLQHSQLIEYCMMNI